MQVLDHCSGHLRQLVLAHGEPIVLLDERQWDAMRYQFTQIGSREMVDDVAKGDLLYAGVRYMLKSSYDKKVNR